MHERSVHKRLVIPFAYWKVRRTDLDSERVLAFLLRLKHTGRVGDTSATQPEFFL